MADHGRFSGFSEEERTILGEGLIHALGAHLKEGDGVPRQAFDLILELGGNTQEGADVLFSNMEAEVDSMEARLDQEHPGWRG